MATPNAYPLKTWAMKKMTPSVVLFHGGISLHVRNDATLQTQNIIQSLRTRLGERGREGGGERETDTKRTDRKTERVGGGGGGRGRQIDRQTDIDRQTERGRDRETQRESQRQTDRDRVSVRTCMHAVHKMSF